jgi:hypothetical protein
MRLRHGLALSHIAAQPLAEARNCTCWPRCTKASKTSCFWKSSMKPTLSQPNPRRILVTSLRAAAPELALA